MLNVDLWQANWARSAQYCRYHGMHLASIDSAQVTIITIITTIATMTITITMIQDQKQLEEHIETIGLGHEHFWTSGTDQGEEGKFVWLSTGRPLGWENWNAGEPNNYE